MPSGTEGPKARERLLLLSVGKRENDGIAPFVECGMRRIATIALQAKYKKRKRPQYLPLNAGRGGCTAHRLMLGVKEKKKIKETFFLLLNMRKEKG